MKRTLSLLVIICIVSIASLAHARAAKMVFWYPGEAGSTEEAQGLLDELFEYLKKKNAKLDINGAYFNTVDGGKSYIKKDKPALGIISYPAYVMNKDVLGNTAVILATLPLPLGKNIEQYHIVGPEKLADNGQILYMSEPLTRDFITKYLYPDLPASIKLKQTPSLLSTLKKMSKGEIKGYALLTTNEYMTLTKMTAPWTKEVTKGGINICKPIPSARFVMFGDYPEKEALISTLMGMQSDPDGKAILEELRLTGFAKP